MFIFVLVFYIIFFCMGKQKCLLTFAHLSLHSLKSTSQHCHRQHLAFYCLSSTNVLETTLSECLTSLSCHIFNAAYPLVQSTTPWLHSVLIQCPVPKHSSLLIHIQCLSKTTGRLPTCHSTRRMVRCLMIFLISTASG